MKEKRVLDIYKNRKIFFAIPIIIIALTIIFTFVLGLEVAIEFKGGTLLTYSYVGEVDISAIKKEVEKKDVGTVNVTLRSAFNSDTETFAVSFTAGKGLTADIQYDISTAIQAAFPDNKIELASSQDVNPSTGGTFFAKCAVAVGFSFLLLIIYIAFRFKKIGGWSAGVFALVALLHDIIMVYATFLFFRLPIDANFMAVILTILGYSINNTIVVYDRIRENKDIYGKKMGFIELVNTSISQTLSRSINTTLTTGFAVLVICIVAYICGVTSIISFAFPMIIGLVCGFYSSTVIAGPLWVMWQEHKLNKKAENGKTPAKAVKKLS